MTYTKKVWQSSNPINASDLNNQETGLVNVHSDMLTKSHIGAVISWPSASIPTNWLKCDGTVYNQVDYPSLCTILGSTYGGNGTSTFGVPNMKGIFIRCIDNGRGLDSARAAGNYQADENKQHTHTFNDLYNADSATNNDWGTTSASANSSTGRTSGNSGGAEGRPKNIALYYIIKAK